MSRANCAAVTPRAPMASARCSPGWMAVRGMVHLNRDSPRSSHAPARTILRAMRNRFARGQFRSFCFAPHDRKLCSCRHPTWGIGAGGCALGHIQSEELGKVFPAEDLGSIRSLLGQREPLTGLGDEFLLVDFMESKKEFGLLVQPGADAVEDRRDMLAHRGPVRATARKPDLVRRRK